MAQSPVYNPPIPYLGPIPGGLSPGKMITVDGFVPHHSQRFAINIQCGAGTNPRDDIAFHINVRFQEMCIVRNHLQGISWGVEDCSGGMPLAAGNAFQVIVLCEQNSFKLAFNGNHFCEFPHRLPMQRASHITIDGDVTVSMLQFQGGNPGYQPPNAWGGAPQSAPPMGAPPMGMPPMAAPPPYGPPPPYCDQNAFNQSPAAFSYAPVPQVGGYQQMPQAGGFQQPPQGGGYPPQMPPYGNPAGQYKKKSSMGVKALKYGLPLAGVGLGAYALGGGFSHSSSSSDDDWFG